MNLSTNTKPEPDLLDRFLELNNLPPRAPGSDLESYWNSLDWDERESTGQLLDKLMERFQEFLEYESNKSEEPHEITSLDVLRGFDKSGNPETHDLHFVPGDVVCLVGPTGAGKSRFLADIECLAQGDTPTGRRILLNGENPNISKRFSGESGLVAQITQNMNFVMDLAVEDFLHMHAESRSLEDPDSVVKRVLDSAVHMAGEPFGPRTQITQLSGGQSRALMIADAAYLSPKPIVLIDEIENAGVDRSSALKLFVEKGKIVLLSTHDPLLALSGARRLVIRNGAVEKVIEPTQAELQTRDQLENLDKVLWQIREQLRLGQRVDTDLHEWILDQLRVK